MVVFLICVVCCVWASNNDNTWKEEYLFSDEVHDVWDKKVELNSKARKLQTRVINQLMEAPCNLLQAQMHLKLDQTFFDKVRCQLDGYISEKLYILQGKAKQKIADLGQPRIGKDSVYDQEGKLAIDRDVFIDLQQKAQRLLHVGAPYVGLSGVWSSKEAKFGLAAKEARGFFWPGYEWVWGAMPIDNETLIGDTFKEQVCFATLREIRRFYELYRNFVKDVEDAPEDALVQSRDAEKARLQERIYYFLKDFGPYIDESYIQKGLAAIEESFWSEREDFVPMSMDEFWLLGEVNAEQKLHFKDKVKEPFKDPDISQIMATVRKLPWQEWQVCLHERALVVRDFAARCKTSEEWARLCRADGHKFLSALRDLCIKHPDLNLKSVEDACALERGEVPAMYADDKSLQDFLNTPFDGQVKLALEDIEHLIVLSDRYRRSSMRSV